MKKFDLFNSILLSLACDLDIIIIGETWLNYDIINLYNLIGFKAYHSCRAGVGGGLCIYIYL